MLCVPVSIYLKIRTKRPEIKMINKLIKNITNVRGLLRSYLRFFFYFFIKYFVRFLKYF